MSAIVFSRQDKRMRRLYRVLKIDDADLVLKQEKVGPLAFTNDALAQPLHTFAHSLPHARIVECFRSVGTRSGAFSLLVARLRRR